MSAFAPETATRPNFRRWVRKILGALNTPDALPAPPPPPAERRSSRQSRRLEEIGQFLSRHRLEVTSTSLMAAWAYTSGSDSGLVQSIDRQVRSRHSITLEWLDELVGSTGRGDDIAVLNRLVDRLEGAIEELSTTSRTAHTFTSEYHSALKEHVSDLEGMAKAGDVIAELATIARVMVRRTREVERQMLRSEAQTRALRRRLSEARRIAEIDHLTGLPNRRSFDAKYQEQFRQARADGEPLCVAFCDIDNFKLINDYHGHEAGDRVLKLIAESFAAISNEKCHVARHGGEEFVMVIKGMPVLEAYGSLDALRRNLVERRLVNRLTQEPFGQISFSGGIADVFACGDPRIALRAADTALHRAKRMGRNRIEVAAPQDCLPGAD